MFCPNQSFEGAPEHFFQRDFGFCPEKNAYQPSLAKKVRAYVLNHRSFKPTRLPPQSIPNDCAPTRYISRRTPAARTHTHTSGPLPLRSCRPRDPPKQHHIPMINSLYLCQCKACTDFFARAFNQIRVRGNLRAESRAPRMSVSHPHRNNPLQSPDTSGAPDASSFVAAHPNAPSTGDVRVKNLCTEDLQRPSIEASAGSTSTSLRIVKASAHCNAVAEVRRLRPHA